MMKSSNQQLGNMAATDLLDCITSSPEDMQQPLFIRSVDLRGEERRLHPRAACFSVVDYAAHGCAYRDFFQNISAGGAYIRSCARVPVGTALTLLLSLLDNTKPARRAAEIVWVGEQGIGVSFKPTL